MNHITDEQIARLKLAIYNISKGDFDATDDEVRQIAIALQPSAPVQEVPVAWHNPNAAHGYNDMDSYMSHDSVMRARNEGRPSVAVFTEPLFTRPVPHGVPRGYALVPIEPTEAMLDAGCEADARAEAEAANLKRYPDLAPWASAGQELAIRYRAMIHAATDEDKGGAQP
jgi:hypothetical protein